MKRQQLQPLEMETVFSTVNTFFFLRYFLNMIFSAISDAILNSDALKNNEGDEANGTWKALLKDLNNFEDEDDNANVLRRRWVLGSMEWMSGKNGSKQNDNVAAKLMYSSKNDCDSGRGESWSTAAGLGFEHSMVVAANLSENALQRIMGSLGRAKADAESWEDVGKKEGNIGHHILYI